MGIYEKSWKRLQDDYWEKIKSLVETKGLLEIGEEYAKKFSENDELDWSDKSKRCAYVYLSTLGYPTADLNLYLAAEDPAKCINPLINKMIKDPRLDLIDTPPKRLENETVARWTFKEKGNRSWKPTLRTMVHYDRSSSCKLVPTGKFTEPQEIKIMVCS